MNGQRDFQVTLPSNASMSIYPTNKPQQFRTELPTPLNLIGDWEVALIDIQYPFKWRNIVSDMEFEIHIFRPKERPAIGPVDPALRLDEEEIEEQRGLFTIWKSRTLTDEEMTETHIIKTKVPAGFYSGIQSVCNHIARNFNREASQYTKIQNTIKINHNEIHDRIIFMKLSNEWDVKIHFNPNEEIAKILSLPTLISDEIADGKASIELPFRTLRPPYFERTSAIFIYSDIVQHQIVGDSFVQLMGVAPVKGSATEQYYWAFNPIMYRPLAKSYIKDIEIQLCSSDGKLIPILRGNTIIRLHFRKSQPTI